MNMRTLLVLVSTLVIGMGNAMASGDRHDHSGGDQEVRLDNGKKWGTDAPLRAAMSSILSSYDSAKGGSDPQLMTKLGETVRAEIGNIVKNCKLEPKADHVLHVIIGKLAEGANKLTQEKTLAKKRHGLHKVSEALRSYNELFDHPGWEGINKQ